MNFKIASFTVETFIVFGNIKVTSTKPSFSSCGDCYFVMFAYDIWHREISRKWW